MMNRKAHQKNRGEKITIKNKKELRMVMNKSRNLLGLVMLALPGFVCAASKPLGALVGGLKSPASPRFLEKRKSSAQQELAKASLGGSGKAGPAEEDDLEDHDWYRSPRSKKEGKPVVFQDMEDEEEVATELEDEVIAPPCRTVLVLVTRVRNGQKSQKLEEFPYEDALQLMRQHAEEYLRMKKQ